MSFLRLLKNTTMLSFGLQRRTSESLRIEADCRKRRAILRSPTQRLRRGSGTSTWRARLTLWMFSSPHVLSRIWFIVGTCWPEWGRVTVRWLTRLPLSNRKGKQRVRPELSRSGSVNLCLWRQKGPSLVSRTVLRKGRNFSEISGKRLPCLRKRRGNVRRGWRERRKKPPARLRRPPLDRLPPRRQSGRLLSPPAQRLTVTTTSLSRMFHPLK